MIQILSSYLYVVYMSRVLPQGQWAASVCVCMYKLLNFILSYFSLLIFSLSLNSVIDFNKNVTTFI